MKRAFLYFLSFVFLVGIICATGIDARGKSKDTLKYSLPTMKDVSEETGISKFKGGHFAWGDYNNDGYPDLLIDGRILLKNGGRPDFRFTDVTKEVGLEASRGNAVWGDYNNDGWLDFATCSGQLWKNEKGRFTEVSASANFKMIAGAFTLGWGDFDADGFIDIYVGPHEAKGYKFLPHQLMRNRGDGQFEDVTKKYGMDKVPAYGRSVIWCDYDNDGRQDIYVGNYRLLPNFLWHNNKDNTFTDVAAETGTAGEHDPKRYLDRQIKEQSGEARARFGPRFGHTIGCAWADFNNDGLFDIWVSNLVHKYVGPANFKNMSYDIRGYVCDDSKIYINQGAPEYKFKDIRDRSGIPRRPIGGKGVYKGDELWSNAVCADFDNDTFVDVFVNQIYNTSYAYSLLYRNKGDLTFEDVAWKLGPRYIDSYGAAWADYNCDGTMDLIVAGREEVGDEPGIYLFRNEGNGLNWVEFQLEGVKSNRSAIGARVELKVGKQTLVRQVEGGTGSQTQQNSMTLHFGLGTHKKVSSATVYWPSGKVQKLKRVKPGRIVKVKEK